MKYVNRYLVKRDVISVEPSMNRVLELAVKYHELTSKMASLN